MTESMNASTTPTTQPVGIQRNPALDTAVAYGIAFPVGLPSPPAYLPGTRVRIDVGVGLEHSCSTQH